MSDTHSVSFISSSRGQTLTHFFLIAPAADFEDKYPTNLGRKFEDRLYYLLLDKEEGGPCLSSKLSGHSSFLSVRGCHLSICSRYLELIYNKYTESLDYCIARFRRITHTHIHTHTHTHIHTYICSTCILSRRREREREFYEEGDEDFVVIVEHIIYIYNKIKIELYIYREREREREREEEEEEDDRELASVSRKDASRLRK
jgi:hypothetical protein